MKVWPEKLYTQREVDDLLEKRTENQASLDNKIDQETQTAERQQRQDDRMVAKLVKRSNRILVRKSLFSWME